MTHYNFTGISGHIHTLPIRAISIKSSDLDKTLTFVKLENESSYSMKPITTQRTNGEVITLAYQIEVNAYILHNDFDKDYGGGVTFQNLLYLFRNKRVRVQIAIGNANAWTLKDSGLDLNSVAYLEAINSTDGKYLDFGEKFNFNFEIESVEFRPRLILRFSGQVKHIANMSSITETGNTYLFN